MTEQSPVHKRQGGEPCLEGLLLERYRYSVKMPTPRRACLPSKQAKVRRAGRHQREAHRRGRKPTLPHADPAEEVTLQVQAGTAAHGGRAGNWCTPGPGTGSL